MSAPHLRRQLGFFDATMIVMGGIVGSGIFINPYVVAQQVHTPALILGAWLAGGALAMAGAFIWAELATRLPDSGGQYLYLREAYHPAVAFVYGWVLLLVTQTGGMAAVAVTFARYFREISGLTAGDGPIAAAALLGLTAINCLGVRAGSNVQSAMMLMKSAAIAVLVLAGLAWGGGALHPLPLLDRPASFGLLRAAGAAMIPVAFAYGGWQTSTFVAGEMRDPRRDLSRGLVAGVIGVILLYLSVNFVCLRVLGPAGLAASHTPASSVMRAAMGAPGATFLAVGIAVSTLGFLSQGILTAPRVYYAMARDGLFFDRVGWLSPRTGAPVVAIVLQGVFATVIALSGRYEQILNYVVSVDFISFALTAAALFVFRRRGGAKDIYHAPGHPYTTAAFVLTCAAIVASTIAAYPANSAIGLLILLAGIPVYWYWSRRGHPAKS
ncbi:MAG TPA: amino acid permease [Bryobacteraceae bacterium]|nr:amino acid permease [Bryobacteraceae bacterium]